MRNKVVWVVELDLLQTDNIRQNIQYFSLDPLPPVGPLQHLAGAVPVQVGVVVEQVLGQDIVTHHRELDGGL